MSRRRVSLSGKVLSPMPKWRSLKVGDIVTEAGVGKEPCVLVSVRHSKQKWDNGPTVYWKHGTFLNLVTGLTFVTELDDVGIRGEVIRAEQEKKGIPQPSEGLSLREGS